MNRRRRQLTPGRAACAHTAHARVTAGRAAHRLGGALPAVAIGALILAAGAAQAPAAPTPAPAAVSRMTTATAHGHRQGGPVARAAREVDLQETGYLHAVGEPGSTVVERGHAIGTYDCSIAINLTIVSANHVTATFTVKPKGGSVTGRGSAQFAQQGADGYFGGAIAITGGTGSYAHASGTSIGISGVVNRETFALTVHVHGKIVV